MREHQKSTARDTGPGERLQQARLKQRLTPEDIAKTLRLSPKQIIALESDDYERLPGPTYVRGYLRAYAQLLGLPGSEIVENYNRFAAPATSEPEAPSAAPPPQLTSSDHKMQIATLVVAVAVVGLAAAWWFGRAKEQSVATAPSQPTVLQPTTAPGETEATMPPQPIAESATPVLPAAAPATAQSPALVPPPVVPPDTARPAAPQVPAAAAAKPQPPAETKVAQPPVTAPAQPASQPKARLVLQTTAESWADVRDANNRLLYETLPAGRTIILEGTPPFSVFLGNTDGVRIEYNGRPYDAGPYRRGPTARFTLGVEGR
jgi:cytoskeleton protein RodZ